MTFKMKHKNLKEVVKQLNSAEKSPLEKKVSWKYGSGTYSGDLIPSKETSTHRYARTHNGKIKSLPKK